MLQLIRHIGHDLGIHVVLSSHLLEEIERVSDAVVVLDAGRAVASGRLDSLGPAGEDLLVDLDEPADAIVALAADLAHRGVAAVAEGTALVVAFEGEAVYDVVRDAIADAGLALRGLRRRAVRLEDVFMDQADLDDQAAAAATAADSLKPSRNP
jgi:ABC-2 type transport system ATP-binding protein